jgi:hypothetical protein
MRSNGGMKKTVKDWFNGLEAYFYYAGIEKSVTPYKCLNLHADYAEKLFKLCSNNVKYIYFLIFPC